MSNDSMDKRLRTSVCLETPSTKILIDTGPDLRQQLLTHGIDDVDAILITHEHYDHTSGLDDIRPINFRWRKEIPLYAEARVLDDLQLRYRYIFDSANKYPGKPRINLHPLTLETTEVKGQKLKPIRAYHGSLPVLGFRFDDFCYITDAKEIPLKELSKLENLEVLFLNALHHRKHSTHLNLEEAVDLVRKINPERAFLTHISHNMGLHSEIEEMLPPNIYLAYDGLNLYL
jgi:phosphoribosyl 1,2-cyclic phosphate phosphodiesterase